MPAHIHAELMAQYAEDAKTTDKPWELWEYYDSNLREWQPFTWYPSWHPDTKYRRKPKTLNINGFEVPEPVKEPLSCCTVYYTPNLCNVYNVSEYTWSNSSLDTYRLISGVIHLTEEAAVAHAKALISFTQLQDTNSNDEAN